ncbi:hypothetical protein GGR90_001139 [Sphingopyxis italica]|uniref:Uncharacterized protein n=1 Tax=Sphingopyxis italica TaxID=1129133 RepID=A0A7X5XSD9_9SPHN|nr:hypothetical protein [Sphingopyxis italica]NJB88987.1 hypothetical protein [Sphingopyxis italica]
MWQTIIEPLDISGGVKRPTCLAKFQHWLDREHVVPIKGEPGCVSASSGSDIRNSGIPAWEKVDDVLVYAFR